MTVNVQNPYAEFTGNGVSTVFGFNFQVDDPSWLQAWLNGVLQTAGYTVSGIGNPDGGSVLFTTAPASGALLLIKRVVPADQQVVLKPYDAFPAEDVEGALNKLCMQLQDLLAMQAGDIQIPTSEFPGKASMMLPAAGARANMLVGFDAQGNVVVMPVSSGGSGGGVTAHDALTGLTVGNDHPQYLLAAQATAQFLQLVGGAMTGPLSLAASPTLAAHAATKSYVDQFTGSVIIQNITATPAADGQATVQAAFNLQANAQAIVRPINSILYYRWPSTLNNVYRYLGSQQGPSGWATAALDWPTSAGIPDAPSDGLAYGRDNGAWARVVKLAGDTMTGQLTLPGGGAGLQAQTVSGSAALDTASMGTHVAGSDPHPVYVQEIVVGVANGVASLDSSGKVPTSQLPASSVSTNPKNLLINGGFRINQRVYASAAVLAAGAYAHDRFKAGAAGGDYTFIQAAGPSQITIAAGKSLIQIVEDANVYGGQYVLSWAGTAQARVGVNGAAPAGAYTASPILITASNAGQTISVEFNTGTLFEPQLEVGTVSNSFEQRVYSDEMNRCQRYFEKSYSESIKPGTISTLGQTVFLNLVFGQVANNIIFKATKRIAPNIVIYNPSTGAANSMFDLTTSASGAATGVDIGTNQARGLTHFSVTGDVLSFQWTADAEIP